jgi:hypothetical protein
MTAVILDGKATAATVKAGLAVRVAALNAKGIFPGLGTKFTGTQLRHRTAQSKGAGKRKHGER